MKISAKSGASLATAAAALFMASAAVAPAAFADDAQGKCVGANACKGTSACKTAANACKGQNACKGTGFTMTSKDDCGKVQGAKFEPAK